MKLWIVVAVFAITCFAQAQDQKEHPTNLKQLLLLQLHETHDQKNWFVSGKEAIAGLTAEQANWSDGKGNHSVGQLLYHINYWNAASLANFKGEKPEKFSGNNDDTFNKYDPKDWDAQVKKFDEIMSGIEQRVEAADDATLMKWAPTVSRIAEHNAYHLGEIVMVRKEQGAWNPDNGVK